MPVSITYALPAASCPSLPYRSSPIKPSGATGSGGPAVAPVFVSGAVANTALKLNQEGMLLEALGSAGAGGYAVAYGLDLSDSGTALTLAVAAGQALIDAPVNYDTAGTIALADNAYNWIYLLQNGTLTKTSSASATPVPANPSATCVFLGRVQVSAGAITSIDYSGRLLAQGGGLYRQTGDADAPGDTPPSRYLLLTRTQSGVWRWNGTTHEPPAQTGRVATTFASADQTLPAASYRKAILEAAGTNAAAQSWILPAIDGLAYDVFNNTGAALTFKASGQTGVAVATAKRARIYCNGVDFVRVTPDT